MELRQGQLAPSGYVHLPLWLTKLQGYFDEGTRRKVFILGSDAGPEILKFVDPSALPKAYGGELEWSLLDPPKLDNDLKALLGCDEFPEGTLSGLECGVRD